MNYKLSILILFFTSLMLTGCVDREYADATLKRGCIAGIKAMLPEDKEFRDVVDVKYEPSPVGPDFRHVKITAIEMDGWLETEAEYQCIFQESFGLFNKHHTASIYQLRYGEGLMIGKSGKDIIGTPEDFLKLTDAIRDALYD